MEWPPVEREDPSGQTAKRVSHIAPHNATWTMSVSEGRQGSGMRDPRCVAPARTRHLGGG
jgi:hypothetical protein